MARSNFSGLAKKWPSALVARREIYKFSGGVLKSRTMANLDFQGLGPAGRVRVGKRTVAYKVEEVIRWLEARTTKLGEQKGGEA